MYTNDKEINIFFDLQMQTSTDITTNNETNSEIDLETVQTTSETNYRKTTKFL